MKIDSKLNANYNRLLSEIHSGLKVDIDIKLYRDVMKSYDPGFPVIDDKPISMKDIYTNQLGSHMSFMRAYSARTGYRTEDTTDDDYYVYTEPKLLARVSPNIQSTGKDMNLCSVICSSCGSSTKRVLTDVRLREIISIQLGEKEEQVGPNSFKCLDCFKEKR
jgi:hypothetical protein